MQRLNLHCYRGTGRGGWAFVRVGVGVCLCNAEHGIDI